MPVVTVSWWAGRTQEEKVKVAKDITDVLAGIGIPSQATHVIFQDVSKDDWAIGGQIVSNMKPPR
jgi:4-oxalocrotonate tautomerase family enzyme